LRCRKCSHEYNPAEPFEPCSKCGQPNGEIIAGKELKVISVEI